MPFWKGFKVIWILGIYLLSVSPIHFYTHIIEGEIQHQKSDFQDCKLVNLMAFGQANFVGSDTAFISVPTEFLVVNSDSTTTYQVDTKATYKSSVSLRGPPPYLV